MLEALEKLRNVKEKANKDEDQYRKQLNKAMLKCGNVHSKDEKIILYLDGISTTNNMVVAHHRETFHRR